MQLTDTAPVQSPAPTPPPPRMRLSATQLLASALAAITATVAGSFLGVSGTVIGAAVASVVSVAGNAVYTHSLRRTGHRVRTVVPSAGRLAAWSTEPGPADPAREPASPARPARTRLWPVTAAACLGVFAGVLLLVTGAELIAGRPISDVLRDQPGSGTTVFGAPQARDAGPQPQPTTTVTVTPTIVTVTPTVTATAPAVTTTPTPTPTPTAPLSPSPTAHPSAGSTGSTGGAGSAS